MFWILLGLDELLEVIMEGVGQFSVLALASELEAESEQVACHLVVEMEQLGVLTEGLHDDLGHASVEVNPGDQTVLVNDTLKITVGEEEQLLWGGVDLLSDVGLLCRVSRLGAGLTLSKDLDEFISAIALLDATDDTVALFDQVDDYGLEQAHACMLACVSEMAQVVLQLLGRVICNADIDQACLYAKGSVRIFFVNLP